MKPYFSLEKLDLYHGDVSVLETFEKGFYDLCVTSPPYWGSWLQASAPYAIAPVELIVVFYKNEYKRQKQTSTISKEEFLLYTNGLWSFSGESKKRLKHPAPFPRELPRRCIKLFSFLEDTIFDSFSGSGTTILEANALGRFSVGLEIEKEYCELSKKRILESLSLV
ncbi:DNA-methyltransferase [Helicobacter pylori]|uniref:DNA-methyltransferase n=1 Tax=Helicobacter pylori TaxID=210 RepID=UPI001FD017B6|nr:site-specific DNA-methyltransferase [Helicobacter pylori]UOR77419.1 site-specific DNA-methyltransferase [Helicobacter pylori]